MVKLIRNDPALVVLSLPPVEGTLASNMILSDTNALAASTPVGWDSLATSLGCSQKVSQGNRAGGAHYLTEYLPRDQSTAHHTRRFTITVFPLPEDLFAAADRAAELLDGMMEAARGEGAELRECVTTAAGFGSAAFFDYSVGSEHTVAAAVPTPMNTLTVYRLTASNGAIPSLTDVLVVRSLTASK